ncbi:hypothetical protein GGE65_008207 [Skermanella aerolata]
MDEDLPPVLDDPGRQFDQTQAQRVELGNPPARPARHQGAHRPQQPVSTGMQEQPELVGGGLVA